MGKIKYRIVDKNTIALAENGNKGDIIDLNEQAELDISSVVQNFDRELRNLAKEKAKDLSQIEVNKVINDKERTISKLEQELALLKKDLQSNNSNVQDKIDNAVLKAEKLKDEQIHTLKDQIKTLENQWNHRHISTKAFGEELEKFVWEEFEDAQQKGAFPNAKFIKDNEVITSADSLKGSKGDFIFRDYDEQGTEILSIEIEVKTEQNTTESKKKNQDHFKKLNDDRNNKHCEYALLISELERDNKNFDGIYKVRNYDKMYIVRPQTFVAFINVLKDSLNKNYELVQQIRQNKLDFIDQETFMTNLKDVKDDFALSLGRSAKNFEGAIAAIDKSIKNLQEIRDKLTKSGEQLLTANNKLQGITLRKLTKGCKGDPFKK